MTQHCACCGRPADTTESHHVDQQRGNNDPDNLSPRCRRCHHNGTHDNPRLTDSLTTERYGPTGATGTGPQSPSTGPPGP